MHRTPSLALFLLTATLVGCDREEPIESYAAPKDPPIRHSTSPQRHGAAAQQPSIAWTLPGGWRVQEGRRFMRYATLEIGTGEDFVEVAITRLDSAGGPRLDNINRWREQVGMPAIDDAALDDLVKVVEIDGTRGFSLVLPGTQDGTKAMAVTVLYRGEEGTWFAKMMGSPGAVKQHTAEFEAFVQSWRFAAAIPPEPEASTPRTAGGINWTKPAGWTKASNPGPMRVALFVVGAASEQTTAAISKLDGSAGGTLMNVNRWRRQLGLPEVSRLEDANLQPIIIGGQHGQIFVASGTGPNAEQSRVAFVMHRGATWFIKIRGPQVVVENHAGGFDDFVASIRFE